MSRPRTNLTSTVIGTPDPSALARFYAALLGWEVRRDEPDWATVRSADGGPGLSFQYEEHHHRPVWPGHGAAEEQQMMMHLDIEVEDLAAASVYAVGLGASVAEFQPQEGVLVHYDPDGHPFCLWVAAEE
ncbi:VOC family protein [Actinospica durhamensis]|uniref:VOC family protein n=1 Tax=Actinospica durhamensis TaxID=1508375 RepID=UPI0027DC598D|nr:VOC family protein [Actinospica durhamensis]